MTSKISLAELKKAVTWIEANTKEVSISIETDNTNVIITTFDRQDQHVKITLFGDSNMLPKITKTEVLK